ncbi:glycosyltransferase [Chryseobacterium hagamense]|uniref:Glycosyl transferase n=1 Tax=Chryseobacterium hagamense TaxID=395935 RepID=A0A511YKR6_9FLAO|nr:glycosyltransferase [Chryseobacterium hagamense]GEN75795.1 glycosyl transferase [Chryseobacterium hagamense]
MARILFLTTAHRYDDDRIFYHQAKALKDEGHRVKICSLTSEFQGMADGIESESYAVLEKSTEEKLKVFKKAVQGFNPDTVICSEPLAVMAAGKFKKQKKANIVYDITEWYPSMRMIEPFSFPFNIFHALKFFMIQLYAGLISTHFIFGEDTKKFPLAYFFPFKKKMVLPYYPDDAYIHQNMKTLQPDTITLCYTGQFSEEKGIGHFFAAADRLRKKRPGLNLRILLIGGTRKDSDERYFAEQLEKYRFENISISKPASFETFTETYAEADICFDLRSMNYENHHCLPIKLFYYAASGKPVVYTDLKAIRKHMDVSGFGFLVDPEDPETITGHILKYLEDPALYVKHARNARNAYEEKYNWATIRGPFVKFIDNAVRK